MLIIYISITLLGVYTSLLLLSSRSASTITRVALVICIYLLSATTFFVIDFPFIGLTYIIVYVGSIAILFLFVIMLIRVSSPSTSNAYESLLVYFSLAFIKYSLLFLAYLFFSPYDVYHFLNPSWDDEFETLTDIHTLGFNLFLAYPIIIITIAIILWIVLIGVICLL
jgi:NADH-ubiquinone oxidoreductase chain 6